MTDPIPIQLSSKIEKISLQNIKLKQRFELYNSRFINISQRNSASFASSTLSPNAQKNTLKKLLKLSLNKLNQLKEEKQFLIKKQQKIIKNSQQELEFQKSYFEQKIAQLKLENLALKASKEELLQKRINEKAIEMFNKISNSQKRILELENFHLKNQKIIKKLESQVQAENPTISYQESEILYNKLCKTYKTLEASIKSNEAKYKQKIKELETQDQKINSEKICLQMKILKTAQQQRLLEINLYQQAENTNNHNYNDANFLYKPSIKSLYS